MTVLQACKHVQSSSETALLLVSVAKIPWVNLCKIRLKKRVGGKKRKVGWGGGAVRSQELPVHAGSLGCSAPITVSRWHPTEFGFT